MNKSSNLNYLEQFNSIKFGHLSFCIGILFLPSALPVSFFFLIIALSISLKRNYKNILKDKWNYPLFLTAGVMVISCIFNNYLNNDYSSLDIAKSNNWLDLFNWLPLFLCFGAFQEYLKSEGQRNLFSKMLLIGSIPVLISFILQGWFSIYGPLKTLGGSIVWYQKPLSVQEVFPF